MINYIKDLFSSDKKKLSNSVLTTQTILVAVKTAAYHEIIPVPIGFTIRIYDRKTAKLLVETTETTIEATRKTALALLNKYNKEGE